jgi:autotransporter passenger strand-loop-strand repeat protein
MTLNNVVAELNTIANNHLQIQTFGFGDVWEIATSGDIQYPIMWVSLDGVDISTPDKTETYKFSLFFMDIVKNGEINETEVLSDQLSIAKDVLAQLKHPSYDWNFQDNVSTLEDFTERFVDSVSGWKMNIAFVLPFTSDRCAMPYVGNVSPSAVCPVVTIYDSNGSVLTTVSAGGTYTVSSGGACADATVRNSDSSYSTTVASGGTLVLPNETITVNVNGIFNQTATYIPLDTTTINITA